MKSRMLIALLAGAALLSLTGCGRPVALFNGHNLDGWTTYLDDDTVDAAEVWSVQDGVIHCKGTPNGYLRTVEDYANYALHLEWRWAGEPSNSGVLLHATGPDRLWPQCIEAQLKHQHAGDFVTIQPGAGITVNGQRYQSTAEKKFTIAGRQHDSNELPPGQWNRYDIVCRGDTIALTVNGTLQNTATASSLTNGAICLQSEGSPIEFRNITLTPLAKEIP